MFPMRLITMKLVETSSANMFSISSFTFSQEAKPGAQESSVVFSCNCSNSQSRGLFWDKRLCSCLFSNFFHQNASLFKGSESIITCAHFSLSFIKLAVSIPFLCAFGGSFSLAPSDDDPAQKVQ